MTLLSPGVEIKEKDFSQIIPTVSSGIGGVAGRFTKGPILTPILVEDEDVLADIFGKPNDTNANEWFSAAQFLQYTNKLWVVRALPTGALNATAGGTGVLVANLADYDTGFDSSERTTAAEWVARDPGTLGNGIAVIMVDSATWTAFNTWVDAQLTANPLAFPNGVPLYQYFNGAPGTSQYVSTRAVTPSEAKNDELHILVVDYDGHITGTRYTVLEKFEAVSKAADALDFNGKSTYYVNAVNQGSKYIYFSKKTTQVTSGANLLAWGSISLDVSPDGKSFEPMNVVASPNFQQIVLAGGVAGTTPNSAAIQTAYSVLDNTELYDVGLLITGAFDSATQDHVIQNVAYKRKDAVAFISPHNNGVPYQDGDAADPTNAIVTYKMTTLTSGETYLSYGFFDTGFKYIYDRYNGKYRWVPLNGDIAGICSRTGDLADDWWSPGGFNRGGLKNVIKLAYNPSNAKRDVLYPKGINPVVAFPGQGVVLFGDRTMTLKPSAFDRINVRRLFIILEKAIGLAAKYQLFEFNDSFTRAQFRNMTEPFLRTIQGRRGIVDFRVVCDESNNTGDVIDRNEFRADIYVKPNRSINYIYLSFVATRSDVSFTQVIGA
jgi:hypothetical protein